MQAELYLERCRAAQGAMGLASRSSQPVGLRKSTSNLFRTRTSHSKHLLELGGFHHVLTVDADARTADVEGLTTYASFVDVTVGSGLLPAVVPELKTITVGGAVSGLGIESTSFRHGLVHETVQSMDVLLGNGEIVSCSRDLEPDLFYALPNSYGTLGYILRLRMALAPTPPYLHIQHRMYRHYDEFFGALEEHTRNEPILCLDGTMFSDTELYVSSACACARPVRLSDYSGMKAYYESIRRKRDDWLTAKDYVWRWDTDWFWCSKQFHLDNPVLRFFMLPILGSRSYQRAMRWARRVLPASCATESVIQDVQVPLENAARFADFVLNDLRVRPVWVCPFRTGGQQRQFDLVPLERDRLYVNFGFWDIVPSRGETGCVNRAVERKAREVGGTKALYSSSYYDPGTFWQIYGGRDRYDFVRQKYHATGLPDLYSKCVLRV